MDAANTNASAHWRIIAVEQYEDGSFGIALESADDYAEAHVSIIDRPHGAGVFDPRVHVLSCDCDDARRWLSEIEHERQIADDCLNWWIGSYRAARRRVA